MPKGDKFSPGDLVFAKVKGYPPWPARVQGFSSKDRYKIYFYGTHETASLKNEDVWLYSEDTKAKFAPKNLKRKGYSEGLDQIENTPEIAAVDDDIDPDLLDTTETPDTPVQVAKKKPNTPAVNKKPVGTKTETPKAAKTETPKAFKAETPKETPKPDVRPASKRKAVAAVETPPAAVSKSAKISESDDAKSAKKAKVTENVTGTGDESSEKTSRSGRVIKPKRFGTDISTPTRNSDAETENVSGDGDSKPKKIANKKANVEEKENLVAKTPTKAAGSPALVARTPEEEKARKLEKRKNKLRWLKIEQRLVELDIAVKSSLHLERPSPDRCISALEELNVLSLAPFMLKKQPDIVTTVRRLRKYIGPHKFNTWTDKDAKKKMEKSIETIQKRADQIYNKFKSYFAYQGDKPFSQMFEEEVEEFRQVTKDMDEGKVLSMIRDPTSENVLSDED